MNVSLIREEDGSVFLQNLSLENLIRRIQNTSPSRALTNLRAELPRLSPEESPYSSRLLPRMVFQACFSKKEGICTLQHYTGLVAVSIYAPAGKPEIQVIRERLCRLPQVLAVFTGSSAHSVKVLIPFCLADGTLPEELSTISLFHANACRWAADFIQGQLPLLRVYPQPPALDYGYRLTHDPEAYYQPEAVAIRMEQPLRMPAEWEEPEEDAPQRSKQERLMPGYDHQQRISALFEAALSRALEEVNDYFTEENWKKGDVTPLVSTVAKYCFRSGIPEEHTVSETLYHFYHRIPEDSVRQTVGNVYRTERYFGRNPTFPRNRSMALQIDEFMKRRYMFRQNTMTREVEYRRRGRYMYEYKPVTERVLNSIALQALGEGMNIWDRDVERWLYSERVPLYAPIEEFMYKLPAWDGKDRIRELARRVPCEQVYWPDSFHRWFLSMVAHWMGANRQFANATTPLMIGPQGCGKSTFCRSLLPPALLTYYTDSIDFGSKKEAELFLNRFALINIDEFDQISERQHGFLKHILQKPSVNIRKPHEKTIRELRRYASFIATSNHRDLLSDTSGNRRYICIEVTGRIRLSQPIHYAQLYAQAAHELRRGERYWFGPEEEALLMENNREFEVTQPAEELFLQYFRSARKGEECEKLLATEILTRVQKRSRMKVSQTRIVHFGRILKRLNVPVKRTKKGAYYLVVEIGKEEEKG